MSDSEMSDISEVDLEDDFEETPKKKAPAKAAPKKAAAKKTSDEKPAKKKAAPKKKKGSDDEMDIDDDDLPMPMDDDEDESPQKPAKPKKNKTVDEQYTKMDQREHVLARPDMYVGSTHKIKEPQYVYDDEKGGMVLKNLTYAPALYKIFDEILVNAADNYQRDGTMSTIKVTIDKEKNLISVFNDGAGIPIKIHETHNMWIPEMIFGHLLTGSNFDDEEDKVTGGRNGLGAKLANIYSLEFTVETASSKFKKKFKQTYRDNMLEKEKPRVTENTKNEDWTEITFKPDLKRFEMEELEDDMIELMRRRVWDIAGCNSSLKVSLNGKRLMVKNFTEYVKMYFKDDPTRDVVFERVSDKTGKRRWEVAVTNSDGEAKQVSFVNSIATTRGGTHITHVATKIINYLMPVVKKRNKGAEVKTFQIRNHLWIFVNALINNPEFDSQTKETLKSKQNAFGSKCELSEAFYKKLAKGPVVEQILTWAQNKGMGDLKKVSGKKTSKLTGIAKLDDANQAGGRKAADCTLILTEGDSAKTLAVSGLSVVGRDYYGVFPLKGKLLNVRDATNAAIKKNEEIIALTKIMGLQFSTQYSDVSKLRYGHLMIMADQDHDGSHIKGLVINFIHKFWPSLLKVPGFMLEFITPIVKVSKGKNAVSFFTIPEYEAWKEKNNTTGWKIKYYKGLGTSSAEEAREYFSALQKHRKEFIYKGDNDDEAIDLAFAKNKADNRKDWLRNYQPGTFLDNSMARIPYNDFINKELILFSLADCQRSIPSLVDGLKPGQRKVLFCCFKRNLKQEIRVAQLSGYVSEKSMYHHGEASLHSTIIGMAQNFVGADNINLLEPVGQFGTRLQGGKDSASARYIHTHLSELARYLFHPDDDKIVSYLEDEGVSIEPEWYIPILPMVLVNGNEGIGTGWSTKIPNHNPRDIVENIRRLIHKQPVEPMTPWYRGFKGSIEWSETDKTYIVRGNWSRVDDDTLEVTELPVRTWNLTYKEFLEVCMAGGKEKDKESAKDKEKDKEKDDDGEFTKGKKGKKAAAEKKPAVTKRYPEVKGYKDHGTDTTVHFVINAPGVGKMSDDEIEKLFKLRSKLGKSNMHLFDAEGRIKKFDTPEQIIEEFYPLRLKYYAKRKENLVENVQREWKRLENQVRFILMVVKKEIVVANRKKVELLEELIEKKFDPMPKQKKKKVAGTVKRGNKTTNVEVEADEDDADEDDGIEDADTNSKNYDYLLSMPIWSLTLERVKKLQEQLNERKKELDELLSTSPEQFWESDLDAFLEKWDDYETKRVARESTNRKVKKPIAGKAKPKKRKTFDDSDEEESEDFEVRAPTPKKAAPKPAAPKAAAVKTEVKTEAPKATATTAAAKKTETTTDDTKKRKLGQTSLDSFAFTTKTAKKDDEDSKPAAKKQKTSTTTSVATKKATDSDSEDDSKAAPLSLTERLALKRREEASKGTATTTAKKPAPKKDDSDDEDDDDLISTKKKPAPAPAKKAAPAAAKKRAIDSDDEDIDELDVDSEDEKPAKKSAAPAKKAAPTKKVNLVESDGEDEKPAKKTAARSARAAPKKRVVDDDDDDDEISSLSEDEEEDFDGGDDEGSDDDVEEDEEDDD